MSRAPNSVSSRGSMIPRITPTMRASAFMARTFRHTITASPAATCTAEQRRCGKGQPSLKALEESVENRK